MFMYDLEHSNWNILRRFIHMIPFLFAALFLLLCTACSPTHEIANVTLVPTEEPVMSITVTPDKEVPTESVSLMELEIVPEIVSPASADIEATLETEEPILSSENTDGSISLSEDAEEPILSIDDSEISVWLPDDYSEDKQYEMLLFLQGSGHNLNQETMTYATNEGLCMPKLYESIEGAPFIVIGIKCGSDCEQISNRILSALSYTAEHYSTYAKSGKRADLIAARNHITIGGLSNGGRVAMYFCVHYNEYASSYVLLSQAAVCDIPENAELDIDFIYIARGKPDNDKCYKAAQRAYTMLAPYVNPEDMYYITIPGRHMYRTWKYFFTDAYTLRYGNATESSLDSLT